MRRRFSRLGLGRLARHELNWLFVGLSACVLLFTFVRLAGEVTDGETQAFDTKIMQALRSPTDSSKPLGPAWMENALLDLTALGGSTVLGLAVLSVVGFLLLQSRYRTAVFVAITAISGEVLTAAMKAAFNRPRPSIVTPLRAVFSTSFPSGHAMESAIVYLTLGAILMRVAKSPLTKAYIMGIAVLLTMLVGVSRVVPGRSLSDRRDRGLDYRVRLGVDLLAGCPAIRRRRRDSSGKENVGVTAT